MSLNDNGKANCELIEPTRTGTPGFDTLYRSITLKQVGAPLTKHGMSVAGKSAARVFPSTASRR